MISETKWTFFNMSHELKLYERNVIDQIMKERRNGLSCFN